MRNRAFLSRLLGLLFFAIAFGTAVSAKAQTRDERYLLGAGDLLRIVVFQNADLSIETRVSGSDTVNFPLIGEFSVRDLTPRQVEQLIAKKLQDGQFVKAPQVLVNVTDYRSHLVSVLGNVNRPGRFPLDLDYGLTDMIAMAGGVAATGADVVVLSRSEGGVTKNIGYDLEARYAAGATPAPDVKLQAGDVLYVRRAPVFYIYGEVNRPGAYRLERNMTVQQAVSAGGGISLRGTERGVRVARRDAEGRTTDVPQVGPTTVIQPDDVIYVRESVF
ncbi:polysaccharide export protein EpsE [Derxia gummosa]|uniref:Polysaccharide export protein EpsE n=1 Tax=Derxia gummosa DSM 723 TaxID=1121388 RepID=A0A8B6X842_9BURK|nr:polysaccharide export protein EpsE [Derxia gummosa]